MDAQGGVFIRRCNLDVFWLNVGCTKVNSGHEFAQIVFKFKFK